MTSPQSTPSARRTPNRLIREKSPYLLQHADNPVDWYSWSEEAFAKARAEQKPVFLSIGYSTCHWCHVMEHESFEDPQIAELLNRWFICIKVDREELPDVDQVYMRAVMLLTGQGGWPLTVFLTPDLKPFYGGTYFPPTERWNRPGMRQLLPAVAEAWKDRSADLLRSADELTATVQAQLGQSEQRGGLSLDTLHTAFNQAAASFDPAHGGFGDAPKFPRSHELSFLLAYWNRTQAGLPAAPEQANQASAAQAGQALEMATATLDHMARGGIHDHLGGGFHRYATDAQWLVPHFEKMLYDQALLARAYLEAYRITKRAEYADVARGILDYVLRDLTDPGGGFYTAEDADSEGAEGAFYVWTPEDVEHSLGPEEAGLFNRFYGITAEGNFSAGGTSITHPPAPPALLRGAKQSEAGGAQAGLNVLHIEQPLEAFAALQGIDPEALARRLTAARRKLLDARTRRARPHRDDKILTSWNGLMIASFAYGAATLEEPRYLAAARRAADFVAATLWRDGKLLRRYRDGEVLHPGTLEDYAFFSDGLLELYEAGFDPRDLVLAQALTRRMIEQFWDEAGGGFFLRDTAQPPLIARAKDAYDGALPSGNSIAALVLLRLGQLTADERLQALGRRVLETFAQPVGQMPFGHTQMLIALDVALGPTQEVVIAGDPSAPETMRLLRELRARFLPRTVAILHPSGEGREAVEALAPYVMGQRPLDGRPAAYVCEGSVCKLPTTDPVQFAALLDGLVRNE